MKKQKKVNSKNKIRQTGSTFQPIWAVIGLLVLSFLAYYPSIAYDFVNWDDYQNLVENPLIKELSWASFEVIFTSPVVANYNPLPIFTYAIEHHFFGLDPTVYHLNNIIFHCLTVMALYWVLEKLPLSSFVILFSCALFALHPMRVESVVWVTERKDVLYALFYFLSIGCYLDYISKGKNKLGTLILSLSFFVLALLAKIQAVSLPLTLLCLDFLLKRELSIKRLLEKIPYFALSLAIGLVGIYFLSNADSLDTGDGISMIDRLFIGGYSYIVYLYKLVLPHPMSPLYPYELPLKWYVYVGTPLSLLLLGFLVWKRNSSKYRMLIFGILFFTVNIMFMLQIVGAGQGYLADRFTYVAYLGLFISSAYYLQSILKNSAQLLYTISGIIILICFIWTRKQIPIWEGGETLWSHVLDIYPRSTTAHNNRAQWLRNHGQEKRAIQDYNASVKLKPEQYEVYIGRGKMYFDSGENDRAIADFNEGLKYKASNPELLVNRAVAFAAKGDMNLALNDINKALEYHPDFLNAYLNRSLIFYKLGEFNSAIKDYDTYLKINPSRADIWYERGLALRNLGQEEKAILSISEAIKRDPTNSIFYKEKAAALNSLGRTKEANENIHLEKRYKN